jgi:ABC-type glycerol-3-phosphate transport system substrate-binding protein
VTCGLTENIHIADNKNRITFGDRKTRAYISYSETLHDGLQEIAEHCGPIDGCRTPEQIAVRPLPPITPRGKPVAWVDALALSATLSDKKQQVAQDFIKFAISWEAYALVLNPKGSATPRYLLPALAVANHPSELTPPLYHDFLQDFGSRVIVTAEGRHGALQKHAVALNCQLPSVSAKSAGTQCGAVRAE